MVLSNFSEFRVAAHTGEQTGMKHGYEIASTGRCLVHEAGPLETLSIYLSSVNHKRSILTMRHDGQKRKIIRKMCI